MCEFLGYSAGTEVKKIKKGFAMQILVPAEPEIISVPAEAKYSEDFNTSDGWLKSISAHLIQTNA